MIKPSAHPVTLTVTKKGEHEKKISVVTEIIKDAELYQDTSLVNLNIVTSKQGSNSELSIPSMNVTSLKSRHRSTFSN